MWRRSPTTTLLGVSIEIYRRSGRDLVMGRRGNIPLGRFVTYHWDVLGCFVWDVPATLLGRTERRCYDVTTVCFCWVGLVLHTQWLKNFQLRKELPQCINLEKNLKAKVLTLANLPEFSATLACCTVSLSKKIENCRSISCLYCNVPLCLQKERNCFIYTINNK